MARSDRINARVTDLESSRIEKIMKRTGWKKSNVVRRALKMLWEAYRAGELKKVKKKKKDSDVKSSKKKTGKKKKKRTK